MPLRPSHLRDVNSNNSDSSNVNSNNSDGNTGGVAAAAAAAAASSSGTIEGALKDAVDNVIATPLDLPPLPVPRICILGIHDETFSKVDVLVKDTLFPQTKILPGTHLRIVAHTLPPLESDQQQTASKRRLSERRSSKQHRRSSTRNRQGRENGVSYVFIAQELPGDLLERYPTLEISITQRIAAALGFKNQSKVTLSQVDEEPYSASHVELAFRDAYLTRADMWQLVVAELAGKSMYKGQKINFMNTIKAKVKTIYHRGVKQQSAFFGSDTKPVFRSESARYVLFIQMSREMWGFDTDGTGEIMFHKVVNGFLPELFNRWDAIGAHHLVSIILFTRMEYNQLLVSSLESPQDASSSMIAGQRVNHPLHKDFYRVLVSDMASGQWAGIIEQLKRDFKSFLRDVSIAPMDSASTVVLGRDSFSDTFTARKEAISGRPTAANRGNILEAINVASSQFSSDYIDRDLVRTGLSVIVVSPGTGVFEVDHRLLSLTTDVLIENGVSIDLVCLSRMPLHSVPLFKYRQPASKSEPRNDKLWADQQSEPASLATSDSSVPNNYPTAPSSFEARSGAFGRNDAPTTSTSNQWYYAIPHWLDVSFWVPSYIEPTSDSLLISNPDQVTREDFVPRVKMYEVQMMGIMENELSDIYLPPLRQPKADQHGSGVQTAQIHSMPSVTSLAASMKSHRSSKAVTTALNSNVASRAASPRDQSSKNFSLFADFMELHDDALFRHPRAKHRSFQNRTLTSKQGQHARTSDYKRVHYDVAPKNGDESREPGSIRGSQKRSDKANSLNTTGALSPKSTQPRAKLPRQISLGFRRLGALTPKATPVTEVQSTNALFDPRAGRPGSSYASTIASSHTLVRQKDEKADSETDSVKTAIESSQPITIKQTHKDSKDFGGTVSFTNLEDHERILLLQERLPVSKDDDSEQLGLSPHRAMAPWLTGLNPCNPSSHASDPQRRLGRWHHVFPKPIHASHVKWKSLCSPASVPLTTEDFPSLEQLATEYDEKEYTVTYKEDGGDLWGDGSKGKWLPREMISARFSHGFQVVVSETASQYFQLPKGGGPAIFDDVTIRKVGSQIVLSRGPNIHKLTTIDDGRVEVKILTRRSITDAPTGDNEQRLIYRPGVRTYLSKKYTTRELIIAPSKGVYDWQRLDEFIGGIESRRNDAYPNLLNFWRARYVLIPTERMVGQKRRLAPVNEDNEEEIRLEGIRKLTQFWQKYRYVLPADRGLHFTRHNPENNPLAIIYRTMKPSSVLAAESNVLESDEDAANEDLPESDLYEKTDFELDNLAQVMQSDRGVRITNRRWHWRLHYNCFIGIELTTWLLNNFRDIDSREDAVELGNELMKKGLFVHVERRHNFRDGNFFYQFGNDYIVRKETRGGWFGRSVPSTPMAESMRATASKSRSGQSIDEDVNKDGGAQKEKPAARLSESLVYDVDHRRRSYRPELIVLHYDRISTADDCYHLRIDWINVTPKLIEDAISTWALLAEKNGLRLVELPITEASQINEYHPFRGPYLIKLARAPPENQPPTYFDTVSLLPKSSPRFLYQEAILRKFDFVLDLEAATDFPTSVDVTYSWGTPDYKYPQYISRTGVILAQITDAGDLLLLANRLYNNRSAGLTDSQRSTRATQSEAEQHHSPARQPAAKHLTSPRSSPFPSPLVRAIPDGRPGTSKTEFVTPEKIKDELEKFCSDTVQLEQFYNEILKQAPTPAPLTPIITEHPHTGLAPPPLMSLHDEALPVANLEEDGLEQHES